MSRNEYKKFEVMLTRRAKVYSSSSSQTVSLFPACSSQLDFVLQQKIAKINNKQRVE